MRERPIRLAWKATRREIGTWVRIPFPPPDNYKIGPKLYEFCYNKPMTEIKYNLLFIPHFNDRVKISSLRKSICKRVFSTQALQYPVHMSVISGGFEVHDYKKFEAELKDLLKKEKPVDLNPEKMETFVLPEKFWTGIHIDRAEEITQLQTKLQDLRNKHTDDKKELKVGQLHITLAFPAKVDELKPSKCPVEKMYLDRISIVKRVGGPTSPYKLVKHINF